MNFVLDTWVSRYGHKHKFVYLAKSNEIVLMFYRKAGSWAGTKGWFRDDLPSDDCFVMKEEESCD